MEHERLREQHEEAALNRAAAEREALSRTAEAQAAVERTIAERERVAAADEARLAELSAVAEETRSPDAEALARMLEAATKRSNTDEVRLRRYCVALYWMDETLH